MASIYVLNNDGSLFYKLSGDVQTLLLNIPEDLSYTLVEPENLFEQRFDLGKAQWVYPESFI